MMTYRSIMNLAILLRGGHPNSLGRTLLVVEIILDRPDRIDELYLCYQDNDPVVRLRTSSVFKRLFHARPDLFDLFVDRFLDDVAKLDQASAQWTIADLMAAHHERLSSSQRNTARDVLIGFLRDSRDWIVCISCMKVLTQWCANDPTLRDIIRPYLEINYKDTRQSVSKQAEKSLRYLKETTTK